MTNGELLLHWFTHVGEGSWPTFRRALSAIAPDEDQDATATRMRIRLSEMGHVGFFINGSNRWRTYTPVLGGLCKPQQAFLSGGRTPRLVRRLARSCEKAACSMAASSASDGLDRILVAGPHEAMGQAAREAGLSFVPDIARAMSAELVSLEVILRAAAPAAAPANWSVRSFDLQTLRWVDGLVQDTAYEYRSRYGPRRHYVRARRHYLLHLERRAAVYAAARLHRLALLSYDAQRERLLVPRGAPLPEAMARVAAACSGMSAAEDGGRLVYVGVPPVIAAVLMVAVGQLPPEPNWLTEGGNAG